MKRNKITVRIVCMILLLCMVFTGVAALTGCSKPNREIKTKTIVTTTFPVYEWVRNVCLDYYDVVLLEDNGADLHNFQPTVSDIATIKNADLFVYIGGESDEWVNDTISKDTNSLNLMESIQDSLVEEGSFNGASFETEEESEDEPELDEHIWLSLNNAILCVDAIEKEVSALDPQNESIYKSTSAEYINSLQDLESKYQESLSENGVLVFGDRFPFTYLTNDYGLTCYAAFSGCSAETEASFDTITKLSECMDENHLNVIYTIDGSDNKIAESVIENTSNKDAEIHTLNSMQSITKHDIDTGVTYLDVMEDNLNILKTDTNICK